MRMFKVRRRTRLPEAGEGSMCYLSVGTLIESRTERIYWYWVGTGNSAIVVLYISFSLAPRYLEESPWTERGCTYFARAVACGSTRGCTQVNVPTAEPSVCDV